MREKIDFVILWVDGSDPRWQSQKQLFCEKSSDNGSVDNRYRDWGLMRYWFRGVEKFAPWVNKIFFVTNGQVPEWLDARHPKLRLVKHEDYIPKEYLPTFNSNVIELWLHKISDLSDKFVLFNDDMFLIDKVMPTDFFKKERPLDAALMDTATAPGPEDCLPHMLINNFALINKHFDKKDVLKKNARKFFHYKYGKELLRNLLLFPFQDFSCFRDLHLPSSHLKDTYEKVWNLEGELLEECGTHRFRSKQDLTHWLMKCWQICEGNFEVRSTRWGRHFELWEDEMDMICQSIEKKRYKVVCLNDSKMDIDFEYVQKQLEKSFQRLFPEQSGFEKEIEV